MKPVSFISVKWLAHSTIYSSVLILLLVCALRDLNTHVQSIGTSHTDSQKVAIQNHLSSNDFDFTKGSGREETFHHAYTFTAETENVLRNTAYDFYHCCLLTQKLAFFTHSPYLNSLPSLWNPSIPIAHRKLLI